MWVAGGLHSMLDLYIESRILWLLPEKIGNRLEAVVLINHLLMLVRPRGCRTNLQCIIHTRKNGGKEPI